MSEDFLGVVPGATVQVDAVWLGQLRSEYAEEVERSKYFHQRLQTTKAELAALRAEPAIPGWLPIASAPHDNQRPLYLARIVDGELAALDFDGVWEHWSEGPEMPHIHGWDWCSANGLEEPTHWAYQDEPLPPSAIDFNAPGPYQGMPISALLAAAENPLAQAVGRLSRIAGKGTRMPSGWRWAGSLGELRRAVAALLKVRTVLERTYFMERPRTPRVDWSKPTQGERREQDSTSGQQSLE